MLLSLYYLFCFSSDLNIQKKKLKIAVQLKTREISSILTVKQCSITFVQLIRLVYGTLLIQYPNACKTFILLFLPKMDYQAISFLFLDVNQQLIAKMDNFQLLQTIERVPELRFKYIGCYPSYKVPPSNDRREHWIMIVRLDKTYYFADLRLC